jgi:hypothetical protein
MSETQTLARDAGKRFDEAVGFAFEDAQLRLLRYHLLRLTAVALDRDEVPLIVELARRAFDGADVTDQARAIRDRPGATVLAAAIADIVEGGRPIDVLARPAEVVVAAVVGAYAGLMNAGSGNREAATAAAVLGAVGGATAVSVGGFIHQQIEAVGVPAYLALHEPD